MTPRSPRCGRASAAVMAAMLAAAATTLPAVGQAPRPPSGGSDEVADLLILGGRVMDPATGLDAGRDVAITDGRITAVAHGGWVGRDTLDATGLVVAPGFIDLHAHGQDPVSARLQARDGVTTALEMEIGVYPMAAWLESREGNALIHYGATASHPGARVKLLTGVDVGHSLTAPPQAENPYASSAMYEPLDDARVEDLAVLLERGLDEGGLGIGFGITYTPGASRTEIYRLFQLAARRNVPAYVHLRGEDSGGTLGAFQEVIANAASTGAPLQIVHLNSSSGPMARIALEMIRGARARGVDVTVEAYPYTASATYIESALFDPWEGRADSVYHRLQWPGTGERLTTETFRTRREEGGWVVIHGRSEELNEWIVAQPDVMVASDGIPYAHQAVHPRGAGTFARVLGRYARDRGSLGLMEALAKMTILPARRLEGAAPAMRRKGRVQRGADADLTLFDPATVIDRATYAAPDRPSAGIVHVLVEGTPVVRHGELVEGVAPGRAIRGTASADVRASARWSFEPGMIFPADRSLHRPEDGVVLPDGRLIVADQIDGLRLVETSGASRPFGDLPGAGYRHDPPDVSGGPNGVTLDPSGTHVLVSDVFRGGIYRVDVATEETELVHRHRYGVNTARADSRGGIWFSQSTRNRPENGEEELFRAVAVEIPDGALFYLPPAGSAEGSEARLLVDGLSFANGIALDERAGHLYLSETMAGRVLRFRADVDAGQISDRSVALAVDHPDNLELDADGHLWIASPVRSEVVVYDPATRASEAVFRIATPESERLIDAIEARQEEGKSVLDLLVPGLWEPGPGLITGMIVPDDGGPVYLTGLGEALIRLEWKGR